MNDSKVTVHTCPKCGYARRGSETNPAWQCPDCGVAYKKYGAYVERVKAQLAPLETETDAKSFRNDSSIWSLIAANCLTLALAFYFDWQLVELIAVYWVQNLIIGASYLARIHKLERFATDGFSITDEAMPPNANTRRKVAAFFLLVFGCFHLVYLLFIVSETGVGIFIEIGFFVCAIAFAANHYYSYRYNLALDQQGTPNIGKLMVTPYSRILPMHMILIFGSTLTSSGVLLVFGLLKVIADVLMHLNEHRWLRGSKHFAQ